MKNRIFLVIVCLVFGALIGKSFQHHGAKTSSTPDIAPRRYAMNFSYSGWSGWQPAADIGRKMSRVIPGLSVTFGGPVDSDPNIQIEEMELLIQQKVNGIIVLPTDPQALSRAVNKAVDSGIPVVTIAGDTEDSKRLTLITADERNSARRLVERSMAAVQGRYAEKKELHAVIITARIGVPNLDLRVQGAKDAFAQDPRVRVIDVLADQNEDAKGAELVSAAWERAQGLDFIVGVDARAAMGALSAVRERHKKPGEVTIIAYDNDEDMLQAIKDGWIQAASTPNFAFMVQTAISILEAANRNYLYTDLLRLHEQHLSALPPRIDIQQTFIDKSNVDGFFRKS